MPNKEGVHFHVILQTLTLTLMNEYFQVSFSYHDFQYSCICKMILYGHYTYMYGSVNILKNSFGIFPKICFMYVINFYLLYHFLCKHVNILIRRIHDTE